MLTDTPIEASEGTEEGQLRLIEGGFGRVEPKPRPDWNLDDRTRQVGRLGIAQARAVLRQACPPEVLDRDRQAS